MFSRWIPGPAKHYRDHFVPSNLLARVIKEMMLPADQSAQVRRQDLWAVTCFFNPSGYRRRLQNFRMFRKNLKIPLVAVELAYNRGFELSETDADILIRFRKRDILWQKERLLNIACRHVPSGCHKIACIDCDVIFGSRDWVEETSQLLDRFEAVQLFEKVHHCPKDVSVASLQSAVPDFTENSFAAQLAAQASSEEMFAYVGERHQGTCSRGIAWAYRREVLDRLGLYDACVIGGGDTAITCASFGRFDSAIAAHRMNPDQAAFYLKWARPFSEFMRGSVSVVKGDVFHLWHGHISHRGYLQRHVGLAQFRFDPCRDIALDEDGCWRWNSDKPDLHNYVRQYFESRREDG